ncbi:MAG TPA: S-layer homology domain-containing protein [Candidatus Agathobaculum merdigallinarum]|nr:S-layer homology domain-containing protein [Candidatus Agathobaculum merdigallinarum]
MKKRLLSALMAASMVLTMVPPAFAADPSNTDITDAQSLQNALDAAGEGGWVEVTTELNLGDTEVTVPAGVGLDAGDYLITGKVKAQAGSSVYVVTDDTQYIIGENTLNLTSGTATVDFAQEGTTTTIDAGATAEIVGSFMNNAGKGDETYRLPKADQLIVNGDLAVKHDMTAVGKLTVNGSVNVENGNSLTLKKMETEDDTVRMDVAESGSVTVKNGATLDVGGYYAQGKVTAEAGATVEVWDITQWVEDEHQMIGQNSLNVNAGSVEVNFGETATTTTITKDSEATIAGSFMDDNSKNAYRIPKADQMIVDGKLNVSYPMEVSGTVAVNGETVIANGGSLELVRLLSGSHAGTLTIAGAAQLLVQIGATLKGTNGTVNGAIHKESGATVEVPEDVDVYEIFTVTFDANEGTFADGTATKSANTDWDGRLDISTVEQPTRMNYAFDGWQNGSDILGSGIYTFTADTTLTAVWSETEGDEATVAHPAPPAVAEPELPPDASEEVKNTANAVKEELAKADSLVDASSLTDAAKSVAENNTVTVEDGKAALVENGVTVTDGDTVTIVVQPYMDIAISNVTIEGDGSKTLTLDITPMYRTVATTNANDIELGTNAVQLDNATLAISKPVVMTIPLPADYTTETTLYVDHVKGDITYVYTGTVESDVLTFTNPHGFSQFTITSVAPVATIDGVGFTSLRGAVDDVKEGQTIVLMADNLSAVVGREVSFKVDMNGHTGLDLTADSGYSMSVSQDGDIWSYTFTRTGGGSSSGGGGGSSSGTNAVSVAAAENGSVSVSPRNASEGATVTITVTPDAGYELDTLTVTDADGNNVSLTRESATRYTFTMPDSKVTVKATFTEITEQPADLPFGDIASSAWYAEAVRYVYENGMMNGTSANTFSPNATTNRAMIVTILHRLENEPAASASGFMDVAAGSYYADAVAWAAANGIVNGVSETSFAPNAPVTREQLAAILYRYAQLKGYDVTASGSLNGYADASQTSSYAVAAMQWANAEGLISGISSTVLDPQGSATRAQVATILMRFCENIAQ